MLFFFGEIYVDLLLLIDVYMVFDCVLEMFGVYCGNCMCCIDVCLIGVIVELYCVDVCCCILYLMIELKGSIFELLWLMIGNCVYGCDDC